MIADFLERIRNRDRIAINPIDENTISVELNWDYEVFWPVCVIYKYDTRTESYLLSHTNIVGCMVKNVITNFLFVIGAFIGMKHLDIANFSYESIGFLSLFLVPFLVLTFYLLSVMSVGRIKKYYSQYQQRQRD